MSDPGLVRYPGGRKALWGLGAYLLGYGIVLATLGGRLNAVAAAATMPGTDTPVSVALAANDVSPPAAKAAGWFFYNAHAVEVVLPVVGEGVAAVNLLARAGFPYVLVLALPPVLLTAAGAMVTRDAPGPADLRFDLLTGGERYAANGAMTVLFGYAPAAFVGAGLASAFGYGVRPMFSIILAGMVYPVVFGALGGRLGQTLAERRGESAVTNFDADDSGW